MKLNSKTTNNTDIDDVAVLTGKVKTFRTFVDGAIRMIVEVDQPYHDIALHWFNETNATVVLARLNPETFSEEKSAIKKGSK